MAKHIFLLAFLSTLGAPALARATDSASVLSTASGFVIVVQGDSSNNHIDFTEGGADPNPGGYQYGSEIWDSAPGETVTAGPGCLSATDTERGPSQQVVYCGSTTVNKIQLNGNGGDDTIRNQLGTWWAPATSCGVACDRDLKSVTINGGEGNDDIYPLSDNDAIGSTMTVNGGPGNDVIDAGHTATHANLTLNGGAGDDTITGGQNQDAIDGGPGHDQVTAGGGRDAINVYDGVKDAVRCKASGNDDVLADQFDSVVGGCAKVVVKKYGGSPVKVTVSLPAHQKPVKKKKLLATVGCSAACYMGAFAVVKIGKSKPFDLGSRVFHLAFAGRRTIPLKFSKKQLKAIKAGLLRGKVVSAAITGVLTNASGLQILGTTHPKSLRIKS